jgi:hypothetical protein
MMLLFLGETDGHVPNNRTQLFLFHAPCETVPLIKFFCIVQGIVGRGSWPVLSAGLLMLLVGEFDSYVPNNRTQLFLSHATCATVPLI